MVFLKEFFKKVDFEKNSAEHKRKRAKLPSRQSVKIPEHVVILLHYHRLPRYATKFIEMCLMVTADHGPAVSGAHNTIVCARAGKDLVSSLTSGLLTIVSEKINNSRDSNCALLFAFLLIFHSILLALYFLLAGQKGRQSYNKKISLNDLAS